MSQQQFGDGERETIAAIDTHGRPTRAFVDLIGTIDNEARMVVTPEGEVRTAVRDPANVSMVDVSLGGVDDAPESEYRTGWNVSRLASTLKFARKGRGKGALGDDVRVAFESDPGDDDRDHKGRTVVGIDRDVIARERSFVNVNPAMLRDGPDLPELDLGLRFVVEVGHLADGLDALKQTDDYVRIEAEGEALSLSAASDSIEDTITITDALASNECVDGAWSQYSISMLAEFVGALKAARVGEVSLALGEQIPLRIGFSNAEWELSGEYLIAPRIDASGEMS